jgi:hypothetical protein
MSGLGNRNDKTNHPLRLISELDVRFEVRGSVGRFENFSQSFQVAGKHATITINYERESGNAISAVLRVDESDPLTVQSWEEAGQQLRRLLALEAD